MRVFLHLAILLMVEVPVMSQSSPLPASQPATLDRTAVARLVRQLDHPDIRKREEAAKALCQLGEAVLPELEKVSGTATFETQAALRKIITTIREYQQGILVIRVYNDGQAAGLGIKPGDRITHLDGRATPDYPTFSRIADELLSQKRTMTVRSGKQSREVKLEPGKIGVFSGDYDARFSDALVEAVIAFDAKQMMLASERFKYAFEHGFDPVPSGELALMSAVATYQSGDAAGARRQLDDLAAKAKWNRPWTWMHFQFMESYPGCDHLFLHASRQQLKVEADDVSIELNLAWKLAQLENHPDSITHAVSVISRGPQMVSDYGTSVGMGAILPALGTLDLRPELAAGLAYHLKEPQSAQWPQAVTLIEQAGKPELAWPGITEIADLPNPDDKPSGFRSSLVAHFGLMTDHTEDALKFIRKIRPTERAAGVVWLPGGEYRWTEARALLGEFARLALRSETMYQSSVTDAFMLLALQKDPDAEELRKILDRYPQAVKNPNPIDPIRKLTDVHWAELALVRGDFVKAEELLKAAEKAGEMLPVGMLDAIAFLKVQGSSLQGDREKWKGTRHAFNMSDGGKFLVTRDDLIGWVSPDGKEIQEIPPPRKKWVTNFQLPFFVTHDRERFVTLSGNTIYALKPDRSGWETVARIPFSVVSTRINSFAPAFDAIVDVYRARDNKPVEVVWMEHETLEKLPLASLILDDGTWLTCDRAGKSLWQPRKIVQEALGTPVDIYGALPVDNKIEKVFLTTSQGLFEWQPSAGKARRIALPEEMKPLPVTTSTEGCTLPKESMRFAMLPSHGGKTFIVESATGQVRLEGCVNESYPQTYWRQMTPAARRELVTKALREGQLEWPWSKEQPTH